MAVERAAGGSSLIDVLDRVLDKGIVIDAWVRVSLVGIDLITVEARVVVASIDTYLKYSEAVGQVPGGVHFPLNALLLGRVRDRRQRLRGDVMVERRDDQVEKRTLLFFGLRDRPVHLRPEIDNGI